VIAIQQGDIWWMETPNQKRRPVLIVSRNEAIPVLSTLVVAPLTSTIRRIPTCLPVGPADGVDHESVASFDSLAVLVCRMDDALEAMDTTERAGTHAQLELDAAELLALLADRFEPTGAPTPT
jgi:mRNA-degrading endonuclease toxin of MazEF toxin-antitoxin module